LQQGNEQASRQGAQRLELEEKREVDIGKFKLSWLVGKRKNSTCNKNMSSFVKGVPCEGKAIEEQGSPTLQATCGATKSQGLPLKRSAQAVRH